VNGWAPVPVEVIDTECTAPTASWATMLLFLRNARAWAALVRRLRRWPPALVHRHRMPVKAPAR